MRPKEESWDGPRPYFHCRRNIYKILLQTSYLYHNPPGDVLVVGVPLNTPLNFSLYPVHGVGLLILVILPPLLLGPLLPPGDSIFTPPPLPRSQPPHNVLILMLIILCHAYDT